MNIKKDIYKVNECQHNKFMWVEEEAGINLDGLGQVLNVKGLFLI